MASGVCGGTEECWNVKDLVKKIGVALGAMHPTPCTVAWVLGRVGVLTEPLAKKVGPLDEWAAQFHGGLFVVSRSEAGEAQLALTPDGASRFTIAPAAVAEDEAGTAGALAAELRGNVFEELRAEAERRRDAGELYGAAPRANASSSWSRTCGGATGGGRC
jgi:hypothetical protein